MNTFQRIVLVGAAVVLIMAPSSYAHQEICSVIRVVAPSPLLRWDLKDVEKK